VAFQTGGCSFEVAGGGLCGAAAFTRSGE
jgi:hypothetical protein